MELNEEQKEINTSRAKEIDSGVLPQPFDTSLLAANLPPEVNLDRSSVSANSWSLAALLSQKILIGNFNLTVGQDPTLPLFTFRNSFNNVYNTHFGKLGGLFPLKSWKVHLLFEIRSQFQQMGLINIFYTNIPQRLQNYLIGENLKEFLVQTQLPHRLIALGEDSDFDFSMSWNSPFKSAVDAVMFATNNLPEVNNYLPYDDYDMGTVYVTNPFPMEVAAGVSTPQATIRVWTYLSDITYAGYTPKDSIFGTEKMQSTDSARLIRYHRPVIHH